MTACGVLTPSAVWQADISQIQSPLPRLVGSIPLASCARAATQWPSKSGSTAREEKLQKCRHRRKNGAVQSRTSFIAHMCHRGERFATAILAGRQEQTAETLKTGAAKPATLEPGQRKTSTANGRE